VDEVGLVTSSPADAVFFFFLHDAFTARQYFRHTYGHKTS
jgi:hypothetical protein